MINSKIHYVKTANQDISEVKQEKTSGGSPVKSNGREAPVVVHSATIIMHRVRQINCSLILDAEAGRRLRT